MIVDGQNGTRQGDPSEKRYRRKDGKGGALACEAVRLAVMAQLSSAHLEAAVAHRRPNGVIPRALRK